MLKAHHDLKIAGDSGVINAAILAFCVFGLLVVGLGIVQDVSPINAVALKLYGPGQTLANWYQPATLMGCAFVFLLISSSTWARHKARWRVLALLFLLLSADDLINFHQLVTAPLDADIGPWGVAVALLAPVAAFSIYFLPMLRSLGSLWAGSFVACAVALIAGAIVMEPATGPLAAESVETVGQAALLGTAFLFWKHCEWA